MKYFVSICQILSIQEIQTALTAFQCCFYIAVVPANWNLWLRSMVIRQRTRRLIATNGCNVMRTVAEGCARSCAPRIWIAKSKDRRIIIIILVLQKGSQGLPDFAQDMSSRGWKWTMIRLKFQAFTAKPPSPWPHRRSRLWHKYMLWCGLIFFLLILHLSFRTFLCPFYNAFLQLFESLVSIWVLSLQTPPDFMARLAEGRVHALSKWVVELSAHHDVFNSLSHDLSTGPSWLSHNPSTYFWSQ